MYSVPAMEHGSTEYLSFYIEYWRPRVLLVIGSPHATISFLIHCLLLVIPR